MFLNQKQLKQEIAAIMMGELRAVTYGSTMKKHLAQFFSQETNWAPADSDEVCAALALSDRVAERILEQYMLVLPIEEEVTND
jgi:hypothetical protein